MPITKKPKLAIVGKGAVGSLLAYQCHSFKLDYQVLLRNDKQICLNVQDINQQQHKIALNTSSIDAPNPFDIVIVPVKSYQVANCLEQLQPHIQPHHVIVLLHNGMGTIEQAIKRYPNQSLIVATTSYGAFKPDHNNLNITGLGNTHLGWVKQSDDLKTSDIESVMSRLLPPSTWHDDVMQALWNKLSINAVINPLTAIYNLKNGQLAAAKFNQPIEQICAETAQVMTAAGYAVSNTELQANARQVIQATAKNYSSMHQDITFKRLTEIDFINGYIVKKGREYGIHTPVNQQLVDQVKRFKDSP